MTFQDYFPIWNKLQTDQQDRIRSNLNFRTVKKGTILHNGDMDCTGLLLVKAGQLRAYILSDEGGDHHLPPVRPGSVPVLCVLHHALHPV